MMIVQYSHTEDVDDDSSDDDSTLCVDEASVSGKVRTLSRQAWCGSERPSPKGGVVML